ARFLTCLLVSARTLDITEGNAIELCKLFLDDYTHTLVKGHIGMIEENEVVGAVRDLIFQVKARPRTAFLDSKTQRVGETRKLIIDGKHFTPITEAERTTITSVIEQWGTNQADPQFFKVLDAAHRRQNSPGANGRRASPLGRGGDDDRQGGCLGSVAQRWIPGRCNSFPLNRLCQSHALVVCFADLRAILRDPGRRRLPCILYSF